MGELEGKVEALTAQNAKLHAEVAMLNAKVMAVTSENAMLRNSLGQMQATAAKKKPKNLSAWPFGSSDTTKIVGGTGALLCVITPSLPLSPLIRPQLLTSLSFLNQHTGHPIFCIVLQFRFFGFGIWAGCDGGHGLFEGHDEGTLGRERGDQKGNPSWSESCESRPRD